jgi:hypothetical protein
MVIFGYHTTWGHIQSMRKSIKTIFIGFVVCTMTLFLFPPTVSGPAHQQKVKLMRRSYPPAQVKNKSFTVSLRKFPYPYQAMLAISSDADHETLRKFNLIHQFLNTTEMTPFGKGLGLDISDSFFMYNGSNLQKDTDYNHVPLSQQLTYFKGISSERYGADSIDDYIQKGWMDSIHTYGDFNQINEHQTKFTRKLAMTAIQALKAAGDRVTIWIDHGNQSNVDNFGSYGIKSFYHYQQGANPKSSYYHTDLLIPYGIKFVWTDRESDVFGRDSMIYPLKLQDGQKVWGFWRYTSDKTVNQKVHWLWSADDLGAQLDSAKLSSLISHHQYAILAQHLSADSVQYPLSQWSVDRLRALADQYAKGNILVARTSRLLQYNVTQQHLQYSVSRDHDHLIIHLTSIDDPVSGAHEPAIDELRGITFNTSQPEQTVIEIGNTPINQDLIQVNPSDGQAASVSIKWYPADTNDYSQTVPGVS